MMKGTSNSILRAIFALAVGLVMILWPDKALDYLILTIGVLFLIPGLITISRFFIMRSKNVPLLFPIEGLGSVLIGLFLMISPAFFTDILTIVLGLILALGGLQQIGTLIRSRQWVHVPFVFFLVPDLILIAGLIVIFNPMEFKKTLLTIIGVTSIIYACVELLNWVKFERFRPHDSDDSDEVEEIDILDIEDKN